MVASAVAANSSGANLTTGGRPLSNSSLSPTNSVAATPKTEQVTLHVTLERETGGGLGLSIAGGVGSVPFKGLDQGVFVSRLAPGGLAANSGMKVGDKLLEVSPTEAPYNIY